jgi:hypothetical protein
LYVELHNKPEHLPHCRREAFIERTTTTGLPPNDDIYLPLVQVGTPIARKCRWRRLKVPGMTETATHKGCLVWKEGAAIVHPDGSGRRILFQLVPEAKTVKNRLHLDVRVGADKVEAELERLTGLGATFLHRGRQGPHTWVTVADPEGNEFCLS